MNTHAAPTPLSPDPPINAILPSAPRATEIPNVACPASPPPVSFPPCCDQDSPERVNTHAAPACSLSDGAPIRAVFPLAERATLAPSSPLPASPLPVSLLPCCAQVP